ncbi:accessory gene regulator B family protein [Eubacterium sp.]|jgi:accessory gene regulator B|uniref:accessory gene regulator B family protein n=1 Tax=Eubacterium sp. TaxID=142586 RepID=UPI0015A1A34E|nr:accessory gene regulator B family protein [Eubacterium sp.]MBS5621146.1 accessory gene regulator B family protein [Eubacterium sp.]
MVGKVSRKVTDRLLSRNAIKDEDYEIYQYGLEQLFTSILNMLTLFVIGSIMGMIWQGIIFVLSFMLLRKYAGGYHASTPLGCYLLTTLIITVALSVMKYLEISILIYLVLLMVSSVIVYMLTPVEAVNKELDKIEKIIYRKKTILTWIVEVSLAIGVFILKHYEISICIFMAIIMVGISLVTGHIEIKLVKRKILIGNNGGKN